MPPDRRPSPGLYREDFTDLQAQTFTRSRRAGAVARHGRTRVRRRRRSPSLSARRQVACQTRFAALDQRLRQESRFGRRVDTLSKSKEINDPSDPLRQSPRSRAICGLSVPQRKSRRTRAKRARWRRDAPDHRAIYVILPRGCTLSKSYCCMTRCTPKADSVGERARIFQLVRPYAAATLRYLRVHPISTEGARHIAETICSILYRTCEQNGRGVLINFPLVFWRPSNNLKSLVYK